MKIDTLPESSVQGEIKAYEAMQQELESKHTGKWVLLKGGNLINLYGSFDSAAQDAVRLYGRGPYLIRQIGAPPVTLPASLMFQMSS